MVFSVFGSEVYELNYFTPPVVVPYEPIITIDTRKKVFPKLSEYDDKCLFFFISNNLLIIF